jgi:hypothetical protein
MLLLALQFGLQPIFTREFASRECVKLILVIGQELVKIVFCLAMMLSEGQAKQAVRGWTFTGSVKAAGFPSAVYAVQNFATQVFPASRRQNAPRYHDTAHTHVRYAFDSLTAFSLRIRTFRR